MNTERTPDKPSAQGHDPTHLAALRAVHDELGRLEELLCGGDRPVTERIPVIPLGPTVTISPDRISPL